MVIQIRAVYTATPQPLGDQSAGVVSSIAKRPVASTDLALTTLNLDGDDQADRTVHGGVDKAVYAYAAEHLDWWSQTLGQPEITSTDLAPFGENVSTMGVTESTVNIGDRWRWGTATLEVCQPRWPCGKLVLYRGTRDVASVMRASGRTGWYLRVIEPGLVPAAGEITVLPHPAAVSVLDAHEAMSDRSLSDRDRTERVAALDELAQEWRGPLLDRLRR